ncbi:hypothetical protein C6P46_005924 [Rhodotorula mucilaginosa]|uniref:Uncharacterized protein n=1 Tax=Rhodotorula mucilaginosa TaxID=5537 RepID=A0A9P6W695_RHOMI|nr:hypothetical protein C6P46_005924 [Rhodotorula mucilaginosa]
MYHPLPALVPHVLAPASPASTAANPSALNLELATKRLAALDAPRRKFGLSYAVPPRLGLPQLICTGVNGIWSASAADADDTLSGDEHPPWVRAGQAPDVEEENDSDVPYRKGLPRDEEEAERWAEARRQKRRQAKATTKVQRIVVDHVEPAASTSTSSYVRETNVGAADVPARRTRGEAHHSASKAAAAPKLVTSLFSATKATVAAAHTKKRPAGSPPPPGTAATGPSRSGPRSSAATGRASKRSPSPAADPRATGYGLNTKGPPRGGAPTGSATTTQVVGETETFDPFVAEEVLFERGCTQMELPDPTASTRPPASSASAHLPRATPTRRATPASKALAPFSSPGLMNGNGSDSGTMLLDTAGLISTPRPPLAGTETGGGKRESQKQQPPPHLPSPNSLPVAFPGTERPAAAAAAARRPEPSRAMTADSVTSGIVGAGAVIPRKSLTRLDSPSTTGSGDGRLVDAAGGAGVGFTTDSLERERELGEIEDFLHQNISG